MHAIFVALAISLPPQAPIPPQAPAIKVESPESIFLRRIELCRGSIPSVIYRNTSHRGLAGIKEYAHEDSGPKAIYVVPVQGQIREMPPEVSDEAITGRKAVAPVASAFPLQQRITNVRAANC